MKLRPAQTVARPYSQAKAATVANLRLLGSTQRECAIAAGVSLRTVQTWEASEWWPAQLDAARGSLHSELESAAYRCLQETLRTGDSASARWLLERLRPEPFARQADAGAVVEVGPVRVIIPDPRARET